MNAPSALTAVYLPTARRMSHEELAQHQEMRGVFAPFLDAACRQVMASPDVPATFKPQEPQP